MSLICNAPSDSASATRRNGIYLGSKSDAKDRSKLGRLGITHILNVTPEKEAGIKAGVSNFFEKNKNFTYRRIAVYDNATSDLIQYAPSIVSFISNALHYGSVLVHCQRGVSRSTTCVMFYLMSKRGMSFDNALKLVKGRRPCAGPIPAFLDQLKQYEEEYKALGLIKDDGNEERSENENEAKNSKSKSSNISCNDSGKTKGCDETSSTKKRKAETQGKRVQGPMRPIKSDTQGKRVQGPKRPIGPSLPPTSK